MLHHLLRTLPYTKYLNVLDNIFLRFGIIFIVIILILFILGLFIGSFLGVVIDRMPSDKSIIKGRSYCNICKKALGFFDLIPIFSFFILGGKCRYCKVKLSLFYPAVEFITAVVFALIFYITYSATTIINYKFILYLAYLLIISSSFIAIFFIDLKKGIIPDKILVFNVVLSLTWFIFGQRLLIINHLLSALFSFIFFLSIAYGFYFVTKKEGMGGGDIKLAFVLGLFLGFPLIIVAFYISFVIGALIAVALIMFNLKKFGGSLPFGPFMIIGAFLSLIFSNQINLLLLKFFGM